MKKIFLSFLVMMGVLSVIAGPIEVYAQPIDAYAQSVSVDPRCIPQQGNHPTARITAFSSVWSAASGGNLVGSLNTGVHVSVLTFGSPRTRISASSGGISIVGWVASSNLVVITC